MKTPMERLREAFAEACELARGEAIFALPILLDAVKDVLDAEDATS